MEVATVAGNQLLNGGIDGIGTLARFREPRGIVYASGKGLFVADSGSSAIRKIDSASRTVTTIISTGMATPMALCYHEPSESMFVMDDHLADSAKKFIKSVDLTTMSVSTLYALYPSSLTASQTLSGYPISKTCGLRDGKFWVCVMFGTSRGVISSAAENRFPSCAADSSSATPLIYILRMYGATSLNDIWRWSPGANITHMYGSQGLVAPFLISGLASAIAYYNYTLVVCDYANNRIVRLSLPSFQFSVAYGSPNNTFGYKDGYGTNALFNAPVGIGVTQGGSYFLGDLGNSRLRTINRTDGKVSSLIGNGNAVSMDGLGQAAGFATSTSWSMAIDENGTFFVSESGLIGSSSGSVIRQVSCVPCMQVRRYNRRLCYLTGLLSKPTANLFKLQGYFCPSLDAFYDCPIGRACC